MIKQAVVVLVMRIAGAFLLFLSNLYIAKLIGAANYGYSNFLLSAAMLGTIFSVGGSNRVVTKYVSRLSDTDDISRLRYYFQAIRVSILSLFIVVIILGCIFLLAHRSYLDITLASCLIFLISNKRINEGYLLGVSKAVNVAFFESIVRPLSIVTVLYGISRYYSVDGVIYLYAVCLVLFFIVVTQLAVIKPLLNKTCLLPVSSLKEWLVEANPFLLVAMAITIQNQMGVFVLGLFANDVETGLYAVATRVSTALLFALSAANMVYMPTYSKTYSENNLVELNHHVKNISLLTAVFALSVFVLLFLYSEQLLALFGREFLTAKPALLVLTFAMLFSALCGPVALLMSMTNYAVEASRVMLKSAILNIILNMVLVPIYGIEGAAFATLLSVFYWNVVLLNKVYHNLQVRSGCIGMILYRANA